jgi:pimeloyl-ACP methyl ester carboxylesterase
MVRWALKGLVYAGAAVVLAIIALLLVFSWQASRRETKTRIEAAPATGRFVQAGDVEIFIQEMGPSSGPAVLFIHGTGAWSEIWRETMTVLAAAGFHAIAVDLPPFGFSERPANAAYSRLEQARRIIGVLDALNISQATLVGHSFGGGATVEATLLAPERVRALVLVDAGLDLRTNEPPPDNESPWLKALFAVRPLRHALIAATITNPLLTKHLLETLILDPADATMDRVTMLQQQLVIQDSTETVGEWLLIFLTARETSASVEPASYQGLTMPVLIIWGEEDAIVPLAEGEYLHSLIAGSELVVLKKSGHIPQIEDAVQFNAALLTFLSKHQSSLVGGE